MNWNYLLRTRTRWKETGVATVLTCGLLLGVSAALGLPKCSSGQSKTKHASCDGDASSGAFINLCGLCVGGKTGLAPFEGLDHCRVCFGDNACLGCDEKENSGLMLDDCGQCLLQNSSQWNVGCTKITSLSPNVLDKAVDGIGTISLMGASLNRTTVPDINCTLVPANIDIQVPRIEMATVEDGVIQLEVVFSKERGRYHLQCNSSDVEMEVGQNVELWLVDSCELSVTAVSPSSELVDHPFQAVMTVPNVTATSNVKCYIKDKGTETVQMLPVAAVKDKQVVCASHTSHHAKVLEVGVVFTEEAAIAKEGCGSSGEVTIKAPAPVIKQAVLSDDLHNIFVSFDQNVEGASVCKDVLAADTVRQLGIGPNCSFVANKLVIKLGDNPTIRVGASLQLSKIGKVHRAFSDPILAAPARGKVLLKTLTPQMTAPVYRVLAPTFVCPMPRRQSTSTNTTTHQPSSAVIRLLPSGGQILKFNWTVLFNVSAVPVRDRTSNLKVWRSVQGMAKEMKKLTKKLNGTQLPLNVSMFMPGIQYQFHVSAKNMLNRYGQDYMFSMELARRQTAVGIMLLGPDSARANMDNFVEAKVMVCNTTGLQQEFTFEWMVTDNKGPLKVDSQRGKRLRLPAGSLQGGQNYTVICSLSVTNGTTNTVVATGRLVIKTVMQGVIAILSVSEVTVGTGQSLRLDASPSHDPDNLPGPLQFLWCCQQKAGGSCLVPVGGAPKTVESEHGDIFTKAILILPSGSLAIGMYNFSVVTYKGNGSSRGLASVVVLVVAGSPPTISITPSSKLAAVDPGQGVTIMAEVSGVCAGCRMWWDVQQEMGFQYFDLKGQMGMGDVVKVTMQEAASNMPREYPVVIPGPTGTWPGLKGDAQYKLRLTTICPVGNGTKSIREVEGHADVVITTNVPPIAKPLQVTPEYGEALRTQFEFSTGQAYDSSEDMPLQYNFGYRVEGQSTNTMFSSSNEDLQAFTLLPAEPDHETVITPVLQVCDSRKLCSLSEGPQVKTRAPTQLTTEEVTKICRLFLSLMISEQFAEAFSLAQTSLQTLKQMSDQALYFSASREMEDVIRKEVNIRKDRLDINPGSLQESLDFLDMAISTLKYLPISDSVMDDLLAFKDKVLNIVNNNNNDAQKYRSVKKRSARLTSGVESRVKRKRNIDSSGYFTTKSAKNLLDLTGSRIHSTNRKEAVSAMRDLLKDVLLCMTGLCYSTGLSPIFVGSDYVSISLQKFQDNNKLQGNLPLVQGIPIPSLSHISYVNIAAAFPMKYKNSSICIGSTIFHVDYLVQVEEYFNGTNDNHFLLTRYSNIPGVWIIDAKNKKIVPQTQLHQPALIRLSLTELTSDVHDLTCMVWQSGWTAEPCITENISLRGMFYADCKCNILGHYSVFYVKYLDTTSKEITTTTLLPMTTTLPPSTTTTTTTLPPTTTTTTLLPPTTTTTTLPPTTTTTLPPPTTTLPPPTTMLPSPSPSPPPPPPPPPTTTTTLADIVITTTNIPQSEGVATSNSSYTVVLRFTNDFDTTVGQNEEQFKNKLRQQIIREVNMTANMIREIVVSRGSIMVRLKLVDTDELPVKKVITIIKKMVLEGQLNLFGLNEEKLNLDPDICVEDPYTKEKNHAVLHAMGGIVGGVVGVTTAAIVSLIVAAVVFKRKKEAARMRKLKASAQSKVPTYRQFHFEHSIEGTESSLARYRSNQPSMGTVSTLMGFGMVTGLGTQLNLTHNRMSRYEFQPQESRFLQVNGSHDGRKTRQRQVGGSSRKLILYEETPLGQDDQDSGIEEAEGLSRKHSKSLSHLPGTPTDDK